MRLPRLRSILLAIGTGCIISAASPLAWGQDIAGAETLFERGRQLMAEGKLDEACPKFAESLRLAPSAGTALNLANCYEKQGKTASAWGAYREGIALSVSANQGMREQLAKDRAAALEPKLIKLTVQVSSDEQGLEVKRDGVPMTRAQWRTPIPIDPGSHVIEAVAPHKKKWSKTIEVKEPGSSHTISIPQLEDAPPDPTATSGTQGPQMVEVDKGGTLRVVGFITMGVGALALGAGGYFGLTSSTKKDDAQTSISNGEPWSADRQTTIDDGENAATMANIFFIGGGVVLATGAVLTVLGYSKKHEMVPASARIAPSISPRGGGFAWTF